MNRGTFKGLLCDVNEGEAHFSRGKESLAAEEKLLSCFDELTNQLELAKALATLLACALQRKHYPEVTQWKPLPNLLGVLSQIDNMTCGLARVNGVPHV